MDEIELPLSTALHYCHYLVSLVMVYTLWSNNTLGRWEKGNEDDKMKPEIFSTKGAWMLQDPSLFYFSSPDEDGDMEQDLINFLSKNFTFPFFFLSSDVRGVNPAHFFYHFG